MALRTFAPPRDTAQVLAVAVAVVVAILGAGLLRKRARDRALVAWLAVAAAALSAAYVVVYLRGGPRIIDATAYFLQARALADGHLAWPIAEPAASSMGRFLVRNGDHAAGIFPPGYPAVLALGVLAGAPMLVGPLIAALLVVVTYDLARRLVPGQEDEPSGVARLAAALSVVCGALRYHTADTMSHGWAALCFATAAVALFRALDARPGRRWGWAALAGLASGWLVATRPASALALGVVVVASGFVESGLPARSRAALGAIAAACALPGVALLLAHQRAATGSWGASSQLLYYATSDGPPGCFRYGFGAGIGCLGEHGDFVRDRLSGGYDLWAALGTTLRRLDAHLVDMANLEPLALLTPMGAWLGWRFPRVRLLALAIGAQVGAYAPFYFDGNYPGGGARMFADVLPLEHALAAFAVTRAAGWRGAGAWRAWAPRLPELTVALALVGFASRAGWDHAALRDREGGLPMFEASGVAALHGATVFVDTDHGFDLGAAPWRSDGGRVVRYRGDALDRIAWEARGKGAAYRYRYAWSAAGLAEVSLEPLEFPALEPDRSVIEAESLWPALRQRDAWALPEHASGTCASKERWMRVRGPWGSSVELDLPARWIAGRSLAPIVAFGGRANGTLRLWADGQEVFAWRLPVELAHAHGETVACVRLAPAPIPSAARALHLGASVEGADLSRSAKDILAIDALEVR